MKTYSPLRYPGGKRKLINYFKEIFVKNKILGGTYIEPYAGGASIALSLLIDGYASKIIINDLDRSIYAFWYSVFNRTTELCNLIEQTPVNLEVWKLQKQIQKMKEKTDLLTLGFATFFLNRTNRSGILNAGAIGGLSQKGDWKIDARYNKEELINRIKLIARYRDQVEIFNEDAITLIKRFKNKLPKNTLFYFDPPYFVKGKELYLNYYGFDDHKNVSIEIFKINGQKWIVTYDDVEPAREIYGDYNLRAYSLRYSAGKVTHGQEIMANSRNVEMPNATFI